MIRTWSWSMLAAAVAGVAAAVPAAILPAGLGVAVAGTVLCGLAFLLWPWAVLPVGIIGGSIASGLLNVTDVRMFVVMHTLPLVAGCTALVVRHLAGWRPDRSPQWRSSSIAMAALGVGIGVAAVYGLAMGHLPWNVLVATYQVAVVPAYFFLALHTLRTRSWLRAAALLYLVPVAVLTTIELATPGRHGGLLSALAIPPLMVLAGRARGWYRAGLVLLAAVFLADVALASYRGVWLAVGLAILIMLVRGGPVVRRGLLVTVAGAVLLLGVLTLHSGVRERSAAVATAFERDAGHRGPESAVGLETFATRPLVGAGLGQSTQQVYVKGFTVTDVGPVYHAFWVMILANLGLVGLFAVLWPVLRTLRAGLTQHNGIALAFAALTCGFLGAAFFAGPTDGHWELGLLPALTVIARQTGRRSRVLEAQ
ncbi:O-antigen ligase family protein [Micromonospora sp. WMMD1102]|uniref:O-antigen ligase family protein n=1 Tax=Micromonospora sp. WMMD1102 TaxID=3016105 RepID=UPI002415280C|nr:O-antigen ligase family protein [Micromonospora sp. WMMD1102]MDG4786343.1 O-antigen ligase family protein [Micromonospora sp. WMMD1102]